MRRHCCCNSNNNNNNPNAHRLCQEFIINVLSFAYHIYTPLSLSLSASVNEFALPFRACTGQVVIAIVRI